MNPKPAPDAPDARANWGGLLVLLSCVAIWGMTAVAFKIGTRPPSPFNAFSFNGVRFLLVAPVLVGLIAWHRPDALRVPNKAELWRYVGLGVFSIGISETLYTLAAHYTPVANMTLLGPGTIGLFTGIWSVVLREQKWNKSQALGAIIALGGVGVVAGAGVGGFRFENQTLIGDGISLFRSALHGLYLIFLGRTLRERPVLTVTVYNIIFGACAYLPYVLWESRSIDWTHIPPPVWASLVFAVVPTTIYGFAAWNWGMRNVGAVAATNLFYLLPVFAAVAAWAVLGEPLRPAQLFGGIVIVLGILILRWEELRTTHFVQRILHRGE